MSNLTKEILMYSAIVFVIVALIIFAIILFKVYKLKKENKKKVLEILNQDSVIQGQMKILQREDFGEPILELRDAVKNPLDDEIVEFCINTIIKNNFKKILMLDKKTSYELIAISNKTNTTITILENENELNYDEYKQVTSKFNFSHNLEICSEIINQEYDLILLLSSQNSYLPLYEKYINNLKKNGMFLIANVTKNKIWKKEIISKISKTNLKYDILKWYKGFILIVK